ncbi:hypothetical protein MPTK1_8g14470 [Marchantia polymorpha subsp. ruderalis]|uniref:Uncharacterized protein n=1 Tax=Marchantia polymorpha TaxID=3197 RepID=A0A2R6XI07_MARPO|nr:hypothetical protein MARPO_0013s0001 [Marchantia polymorpha]BBN19877.1 hypothetical protein Mp_8g14470 [Marchantia polymorpha subsp. ruderalis]|eukprot:PTQ45734.1 hypothetical protein MARPO_0013s0001 [Marchantia polymorpha]
MNISLAPLGGIMTVERKTCFTDLTGVLEPLKRWETTREDSLKQTSASHYCSLSELYHPLSRLEKNRGSE